MPLNSIPPTTNRAALEHKRQVVANQAVIDYGNWGGLVDNNLADLDDLNADGVIGYKAFASASGVDFERLNDDLIYAGLDKMRQTGQPDRLARGKRMGLRLFEQAVEGRRSHRPGSLV